MRFTALALNAVVLATGIGSAQVSTNGDAPGGDTLPRGPVVAAETKHITVRARLSAIEVAPGARILVAADITPKATMHVYAPGGKYIPVTLRIEPQPFLKAHEVIYPPARDYFFAPLKEYSRVYSDPFRLALDVVIGEGTGSSGVPSRVPLKATLDYQACDDKLCYLPTSVPLQWTLKVKR